MTPDEFNNLSIEEQYQAACRGIDHRVNVGLITYVEAEEWKHAAGQLAVTMRLYQQVLDDSEWEDEDYGVVAIHRE